MSSRQLFPPILRLRNSLQRRSASNPLAEQQLTKRLVDHARPNDVTEGYAAGWTVAQLREPEQKIADLIEALLPGTGTVADAA